MPTYPPPPPDSPSYPNFPTLTQLQNARKYKLALVDPAIRHETDGGYAVTRPRYTRVPPKKWGVSYDYINAADKLLLESFWNSVKGGSAVFEWLDTEDNVWRLVRFVGELKFDYVGAGFTRYWNVSFELEQA